MRTTQSNAFVHTEQTLTSLFPALSSVTIQNVLHETDGDVAKSILLLIQTPPHDEPQNAVKSTKIDLAQIKGIDEWKEHQTDAKNKKAFMKQQFTSTTATCCRILSISFWIAIAFLLIFALFLMENPITISLCLIIELMFTIAILYGVLTYQAWCIWFTLLWSGLHGITVIYLIINHYGFAFENAYYIGSVLLYWSLLCFCNVMYFIKLNKAESRFNHLIQDTSDILNTMNKMSQNNQPNVATMFKRVPTLTYDSTHDQIHGWQPTPVHRVNSDSKKNDDDPSFSGEEHSGTLLNA